MIAREAFRDVSFLYRAAHLEKVAAILADPESSPNDRGVALTLLKNAEVAARMQLPMCQDTGTATIFAKKGQRVFTGVKDEEWLSRGVFETYTKESLRYSQTVPLTMYEEKNSGTNLPAQIDIYATDGERYEFVFIAKGGGSANKSMLFQETKALLEPGEPREVPGREAALAGHGGLPAVPPGDRDRRDLGRSDASRRSSWPAPATSTTCPRPATRTAAPSATPSWKRRSSSWPRRPGSARSSAASGSRSTRASCGCRATGPRARSGSASRAPRTAT